MVHRHYFIRWFCPVWKQWLMDDRYFTDVLKAEQARLKLVKKWNKEGYRPAGNLQSIARAKINMEVIGIATDTLIRQAHVFTHGKQTKRN